MTPGPDPTPTPADGPVVVRSEEQLTTGVESVAVRRMRIRKVVVTEERTLTVQIRREELHLEDEPITGGEPTSSALGDREVVVVLHEERPVLTTEVVAVERARIATYRVNEEQTVTDNVRREVVAVTDEVRREVVDVADTRQTSRP